MNYLNHLKESFSERELLKLSNLSLMVACCLLTGALTTLAVRDPLLIDRSSIETKVITPVNNEDSDKELGAFLSLALVSRFNSQVPMHGLDLLSKEQAKAHELEEKELASKQITQSILVQEVKRTEKGIFVNADRVVRVGKLRSAFAFPLVVKVERVTRSEKNPYGLRLVSVVKEKPNEK
ncbi:MAG: hypothetical protein R3A80_04275 [Bdellovibrionota bacterium]